MKEFILSDNLNQSYKLTVDINGENVIFDVQVRWHEILKCWLISIRFEDGEVVALNVPMLSGLIHETANLLYQYEHLLAGEIYISPQTDEAVGKDPKKDNLSTDYGLLWR